ncbi:hypothetical protein SDC9_114894 [bioreactor metagenome]|jgi:hypothetical protein|uniref:Uncharacterized protein n=1 Tax=bioreactor metagenome TaxID=1076179 RepID=A0A645BSB0_9ZZZZ|nr:hypothetical protein [Oscillibacter sp.]MEA5040268.1 hypothetical protein [Clostridiaceae bacterium]
MTEKYFKELTRVLAKNGIEAAPLEKNTLPILLGGRSACRVEPSGDMCIFPDDTRSPEADELYHRVAPFSRMVKEYMTAIERAPLLKATALDEDFRLLAEFNGVVFAGRETEHGYMFVTWERDYEGTGVICGGYYLDAYEAAKQDFAIRAGLIQDQRLFSSDQLLNIYQSINNTFEAGYDLTQEDKQNLSDIQEQIEDILPDVNERIAAIQQKAFDTMQGQSM